MNEQKLSKRLATVASYVPQGSRLADIGSDHAYLPAWLVLNDQIASGIAGEVVQGPFETAQKSVSRLGLSDKIQVRFGNGLEVVKPEDGITAISIAGMGGTLISEILAAGQDNNRLSGRERLILQPNVAEKTLRQWLQKNQYKIIAEEILVEEGKFYEVIVAEKSRNEVNYTLKELTFGPFLRVEKSAIFKAKWEDEIKKLEKVLTQLNKATVGPLEKMTEVTATINWIKKELVK